MVALIRGSSGLLVPVGPAEVDYSHPLAQGLVSFYIPALGLRDFGPAGAMLTPASGWGVVPSSRGGGQKGTTTGQFASVATPGSQQITLPLSLFWHGDTSGTAGGNQTFFGTTTTSGSVPYVAWEVAADGTGAVAQYNINDAGTFIAMYGGVLPTNKPFSLGMSVSGAAWRSYMAGRLDVSAAGRGNPSYAAGYTTIIGTPAGANTRVPNKTTNAAGVWRRVLTDTDFAWLEAEPFAFMRVTQRRQYYAPAAGGNVIVALTGVSYTLSAGTVRAARTKALTGSSYTLSAGTVRATLTKALTGSAYTLSAGILRPQTSKALTGSSYTLAAGTLTAAAGGNVTVALTGVSYTYSAGTLAPKTSKALTGSAYTYAAGTLRPATSKALTGVSYTLSAGTLTSSGGVAATPTNTGGWIEPSVARALLRQANAYHKDQARRQAAPREESQARERAMFATLENAYAELTGEPLPHQTPEALVARVSKPAPAAPAEAAADAIAVYAAVAAMADRKAMGAALAALDKALMRMRVEAAETDDEETILLMF